MFRFFREQEPDEAEKVNRILAHIEDEKPLFTRGGMVTTPKILKEISLEDLSILLRLHDHGYWGTVHQAVALANKQIAAGKRQGQIVSRYDWDANEVMVVSEKVETQHPLTKIYFVHDDIDLS